jgi:excisionase family DNA binding protein
MVELKDELLTVAEAAALLKVSRHTIYRWIAEGRLPAVRYSRRVVRLRRHEVEGMNGQGFGADEEGPPKGSGQALLKFAGIMTKDEADAVWRAIEEAREASIQDPH